MKNNQLSPRQKLLLKIYEEFESDDIKIEFERSYSSDGQCKIVIKVIDDDDNGDVLYQGSIIVD